MHLAMPQTPDPDAEARHWFLRLTGSEPSVEEIGQWEAWIGLDENARAYDRVVALWSMAEGVERAPPSSSEIARDPYSPAMSVRAWRRRVAALRVSALAACAAAAIAGGGWMWWESSGVSPVEHITTARAEHMVRSLSDGSRVQVAADTALEVQYRRSRRDLTLSRGEALFKVAKDPRRPFTVATPMLQVTAVGTAFDVEAQDERTTVTVIEGEVGVTSRAVSRGGFRSDQVIRVGARQRLVIEDGEIRLTALGPADSLDPDWLVWRREYRREPLREVIADVNRYSRVPIELQDEAIGAREYTGSVQLKDIDSWLLGVAKAFHLSLSVDANGVSLRKKVSSPVPQASLRAS